MRLGTIVSDESIGHPLGTHDAKPGLGAGNARGALTGRI